MFARPMAIGSSILQIAVSDCTGTNGAFAYEIEQVGVNNDGLGPVFIFAIGWWHRQGAYCKQGKQMYFHREIVYHW